MVLGGERGVSTAPADALPGRPVPGGYGPEFVNAWGQMRDPDSLWSFIRQLIQIYRSHPELGRGTFRVLDQPHPEVFAHSVTWEDRIVVAVHNLCPDARAVPLRLDVPGGSVLESLLNQETHHVEADSAVEVNLHGYDHRWFHVHLPGKLRMP